ncbi:MAG: glycosyl hydrolase 115 family protein [Puniceicoccaceae bacterium]
MQLILSNAEAGPGVLLVDADAPTPIQLAASDFLRDADACGSAGWSLSHDGTGSAGKVPVVAGVLDASEVLSSLGSEVLSKLEPLRGQWDAYAILPTENALVVAGSNARGVMYGIYKASELLFGTDPMVAFSDFVPTKRDEIVWNGEALFSGEPIFRYRGIFINDEDALMSWKGDAEDGLVAPEVHEMIIESLCRLGGNMLAPPMWAGYMDEASRELVEARGLFYTASHLEVLLSNPQNYWDGWCREKFGKSLPYSFSQYPDELSMYWRETVQRHKAFTNIWPVGLRGVTDCALWLSDPEAPEDMEGRAQLVSSAIREQHKILQEELGDDQAVMSLTMRDEVLDLWETGALELPDEVILVWDDVGRRSIVRRLPDEQDRQRARRHGAYYHLQFCQDPRMQYLPAGILNREVGRIFESGTTEYLLFNAGNVREISMLLKWAMKLAWNPEPYIHAENGSRNLIRESVIPVYGEGEVEELTDLYVDLGETEYDFRVSQITDCIGPLITTRELYDIWDNTSALDWMDEKGSVESVADYAKRIEFKDLPDRCWCFKPERFPEFLVKWKSLQARAKALRPMVPEGALDLFDSNIRVQIETSLAFCEWAIGVLKGFEAAASCDWMSAADCFTRAADALDRLEEERKTVSAGKWENWFRGEYSNVFKKSLWTLKPRWHAEDTRELARRIGSLRQEA